MPTKLDHEILTAALLGFEAQKKRLDDQIAEIRQKMAGRSVPTKAEPENGRKRRKMSAAGRKRIAAAQRKRWAAKKESGAGDSKATTEKPKRKLSAAGRKRIIEATKKRWAAVHAAAEKTAK
jgi:hypothetical protein